MYYQVDVGPIAIHVYSRKLYCRLKKLSDSYQSCDAFKKLVIRDIFRKIVSDDLDYDIYAPEFQQSKGRPKNAGNRKQDRNKSSTQRDSSQFEYSVQKVKEQSSLEDKKNKKRQSEESTISLSRKKPKNDKRTASISLSRKKNTKIEPPSEQNPTDNQSTVSAPTIVIHPDIPENAYSNVVNIKGDGFCGFRCLAHQLYGDENRFWEVKKAMRDHLLTNFVTYSSIFHKKNYLIDELKRIVCYRISSEIGNPEVCEMKERVAPIDYWFMVPECAQLAACTFGRPIASYDLRHEPQTYLPILPPAKIDPPPGERPLPLLLYFVSGCHFITLQLKRSIKIVWPIVNTNHAFFMESLGKNDMIKSFWNRHLTFKKTKITSKSDTSTLFSILLMSVLLVSQTQPVVINFDKEIKPEVSNPIEQHTIKDCAYDDKAFEYGEVVEDSKNQVEAFNLKLLLEDWDNDFQ